MDPQDLSNAFIHEKSAINWVIEICQKEGIASPVFQTTDLRENPSGEPKFETVCTVKGFNGRTLVAKEHARNKKDAKQRSAISMLNSMGMSKARLLQMKTKPDSAKSTRNEPMLGNQQNENPIPPDHSQCHSASTNGVSATGSVLSAVNSQSCSGSDGSASTTKTCEANGHYSRQIPIQISSGLNAEVPAVLPAGTAVALSENNASNGASESLTNENESFVPTQATPTVPANLKVETSPLVISGNPKFDLNTFCVKSGIPLPEYKVISSCGPPHAPIFTMRCTISVSTNQTHIVEVSRKTSQKILSQILALEMLEKLRSDLPALQIEARQRQYDLSTDGDRVVEQFSDYLKRVLNTPETGCSSGSGRCFETFAHRHHDLQNRLGGDTMLSLKKMMAAEGGISQVDAITVLANLCKEYETNGLPIKTSNKVYQRGESQQFTCIIEFGNSANQMYACYGMGENSEMAEMAAARAVLEFLCELSLNE